MEFKRSPDHVAPRRLAWTFLACVSALLLVAGLSLALVYSQARAQSVDGSSATDPEVLQAGVITSQIRFPSRDAYITQKPPLTITGIAWRDGSEPPYITGDVFLEVERTTDRAYSLLWNNVPAAANYLLEEAMAPGFSDPDPIYFGADTQLPRIQSDGTYYYRVAADGPGLEASRWSNVISVTVPWPAPATDAVGAAAESAATAGSSITVQVRIDEGPWHNATVSETAWGAEWAYEWSAMPEQHNTQYAIHSRAAEGVEGFGAVDTITITLDNKSYQVYLPVVYRRWPPVNYPPSLSVAGLENEVDEDGAYELSWTYSDDNPAVPDPTSYTLQEALSSGFSSPTEYTVPSATTSQAFTEKEDGTYFYRVRGNNPYGPGQWSNVVSVTVAVPSDDFYDDFTDPTSGWRTHQASWGLVGCDRGDLQQNPDYKYNLFYEGGRYKVNIPLDCRAGGRHGDTRHIYPVTFAPGVERPETRTCMQVRGAFERYETYWSFWGLVFAASDDMDTVYSLEVNDRGDWAVLKRTGYDFPGPNHPWTNEVRHKLVDWNDGLRYPARPPFETNTLRAEVNGNNVRLFINGRLIHQFSDAQIGSLRRVGIIGGNWELTPSQIAYDYFYLDEGCDGF